jgi:hypothetical protein
MSLLKKIFTKGGDMGVVMVWANGDEMIAYTCKDFKQVQELLDHAKKAGTLH